MRFSNISRIWLLVRTLVSSNADILFVEDLLRAKLPFGEQLLILHQDLLLVVLLNLYDWLLFVVSLLLLNLLLGR